MKKITADDLIDALNDVDPELYMNEEPGTHRKKAKILRLSLLFAAVIAAAALIVIPIIASRAPETPADPTSTEQPTTDLQTTDTPSQTDKTTEVPTPTETPTPSETPTPTPSPLVEGDRVTENGMTFEVNADCVSYTLVALEGSITSVDVPADVNGYPVTAIGPVFGRDETGRWTMSIPESVNYINTAVFRFPCSSIKITVSEDNPYFRMENGCLVDSNSCLMRASEGFSLPEGIVSIGDYAFYSLYGMTSLTLPEGLASIGEEAFYDCGDLETLSLPSTLQSIGNNAFALCTELKTVSGASVENYESISFGAGASDPAAIAGKLYVDGSEAQLDTHEPDRATDEQAWANWLYNDSRAGFAYKLLSYGLQMTNDYYKNNVKLYDGCGWEYWYGLFYFGYNMGADAEIFTVDIGEPEYAYTWEILYRESGKGDFRSIKTKPVSVYRWGDGKVIFRIPTYKEGMKNLKADCTYDFLFVIHEGDEQGEIKAFYRDEILVTQAYSAYLSDAIRGGAFKEGEHEHSLAIVEAVAPTCVCYGHTRNVFCRTCGQTLEKAELIRPLGHDYVNGFCTRCEAFRTAVMHSEEELMLLRTPVQIDDAVKLEGVEPGDLLQTGAVEASPLEFDRTLTSSNNYRSDLQTVWLRVIFDKTEFDPHTLFKTQPEYSFRLILTSSDDDVRTYTIDRKNAKITDIDDRYALVRISLFTNYYGDGMSLFNDNTAQGSFTAYLLIGNSRRNEEIMRNEFAVSYYAKFSFAPNDSFDSVIFDFIARTTGLRCKVYHKHVEGQVIEPASCEEPGKMNTVCKDCGLILSTQTLLPLGHDFVDGRCTRCGTCEHHHIVTDPRVEPTCTVSGLTEGSHCDVCGEVFVEQQILVRQGHRFVDGVCVRCGITEGEDETGWLEWLQNEGMDEREILNITLIGQKHENGTSKSNWVYDRDKGEFVLRFVTDALSFDTAAVIAHPEDYEIRFYYRVFLHEGEEPNPAFRDRPYKKAVTKQFSLEEYSDWEVKWTIDTYSAGVTDLEDDVWYDVMIVLADKNGEMIAFLHDDFGTGDSYTLFLADAISDGIFNNA